MDNSLILDREFFKEKFGKPVQTFQYSNQFPQETIADAYADIKEYFERHAHIKLEVELNNYLKDRFKSTENTKYYTRIKKSFLEETYCGVVTYTKIWQLYIIEINLTSGISKLLEDIGENSED